MIRILLSLLMAFSVSSRALSSERFADAAQKARVRSIIKQVEDISKRCKTLDEFGRETVAQGKDMLSVGPCAVYALSNCLGDPDWKVRFWIADMLGYLENPDARRPLLRVIKDESENSEVRRQAEKSLKRLNIPIEHGIE